MVMRVLDLTSLQKAIKSLKSALSEYEINSNEFIRDACIQRFEYTYELSWKTIKRYLELTSPNPAEIDAYSFQDLIRTATERGLLHTDWETWKRYRQLRGVTSHAYDEKKANEVYQQIPSFLVEVEFVLEAITKRNL
jgi:nucleotidyltransferase substrate binding protein (TIGR01987 family)